MKPSLDFHKAFGKLFHDILTVRMWAGNLEKSDAGIQHTQQFGALYWRGAIPKRLARAHVEEKAWDLRSARWLLISVLYFPAVTSDESPNIFGLPLPSLCYRYLS